MRLRSICVNISLIIARSVADTLIAGSTVLASRVPGVDAAVPGRLTAPRRALECHYVHDPGVLFGAGERTQPRAVKNHRRLLRAHARATCCL